MTTVHSDAHGGHLTKNRLVAVPRPTNMETHSAQLRGRLTRLAQRGLGEAYLHGSARFPQTMRGLASNEGPVLVHEGDSLRYAAIAALGLNRVSLGEQAVTLSGSNAVKLTRTVAGRATVSDDPGAKALAAWASAEVAGDYTAELFDDLLARLTSGQPIPTVDLSWTLTAAVAAMDLGPSADLARAAAAKLTTMQGPGGAFGHVLPPGAQPRYRRHVGSFADQIYPIQALARWSQFGERAALKTAERTAAVITTRQGEQGQWWWHYDVRDGSVVEGFPVYSVHQHAMAPMGLADLREAGGHDYRESIERGLGWLTTHPETVDELIVDRLNVVWRKVGRRERFKMVRGAAAVTTSIRPQWHLPGINRLSPPERVDHECRPYELGWLLYAWAKPSRDETAR